MFAMMFWVPMVQCQCCGSLNTAFIGVCEGWTCFACGACDDDE